jgi:hypothetical protein
MELTEAQAIVRSLLDTAVNDSVTLALRIDDLKTEQAADPFEGTAAQIKRLQDRYHKKVKEAKALSLIVATF